jgi:hypothetical protein
MIQKNELIELGFTLHETEDGFTFYEKQLTSRDWLTADKTKDGDYMVSGDFKGYITEASELKQLIEIFNRANGTI